MKRFNLFLTVSDAVWSMLSWFHTHKLKFIFNNGCQQENPSLFTCPQNLLLKTAELLMKMRQISETTFENTFVKYNFRQAVS